MVKMAQGERGYGTRLWDPVNPDNPILSDKESRMDPYSDKGSSALSLTNLN